MLRLAKHVHVKFQHSSFNPDELRQKIISFQVNFRIFFRKIQNFPILKEVQIKHRKRRLLPKFETSSI
jgi:hypothetical protein